MSTSNHIFLYLDGKRKIVSAGQVFLLYIYLTFIAQRQENCSKKKGHGRVKGYSKHIKDGSQTR